MVSFKGMSIGAIVGLAIGVYVLAAILPSALSNFFNASTAGWDAGTVALWGIIPLVIIAVLLIRFLPDKGT